MMKKKFNSLTGKIEDFSNNASVSNQNENINLSPSDNTSVNGESGDKTKRVTLSTYQQSSKGEPYGDLIRMIEEHGFAKGGIKFYSRGKSAQVISSNNEPFNVTTGQTLIVKINGGDARTITFQSNGNHSFTSGAASANQISDIITKQINYTNYPTGQVDSNYIGQSIVYLTQIGTTVNEDYLKVAILSGTYGANSSVEIVGGTAASALGFSIGVTNGVDGTTDLGNGTFAEQLAWIVAHHYPNNLSSNNEHRHISIESADSNGEMQSRFAITLNKDVAEIIISSAMLILNGYPFTIANSAESNKDLDFSRDNTGRKISRVFQIRTGLDSAGGNTDFRVFDDAGTVTSLLLFNRLKKFITLGGAIQEKIRTSSNNSGTTLTLSPQNGNMFVIAGTSSISYIAYSENVVNGWTWQAGSELILRLQGAATLVHGAASPAANVSAPLHLSGSINFTSGANGSCHTFRYDGSSYQNRWLEVSRILY